MKKNNTLRVLIPVILIIIFSTVVVLLSSSWLDRNVRLRLENEFSNQSHGQYKLSIGALKLSILSMSVRIKVISIDPVKVVKGKPVYHFSTKQLNLNGVGLLRFIFHKDLKINTVKLVDPTINLINGDKQYKPENDTANRFSLYGFISSFAESVTFKRLSVVNFDMTLYNNQKDDSPTLKSNNNSFIIKNFHIGSSTARLPGFFEADTIILSMKRFTYTQPDSLYTLNVGNLNASFTDSVLMIDSISIVPNFSKKRFGAEAGKQTDRLDIHAKQLQLSKIDLRSFLENHNLIARSGELKGLSLVAHRDKNDVYKPRHPASLQKLLKEAPIYIKIDTLLISDGYASYEEVAKGNKTTGKIYFKDINGKFTGITNDSLLISTGAELKLSAQSKLLNEANFRASYRFPLNTELTDFDCAGLMTGLSMASLNVIIEPLVGIKAKEGYIDTLDFAFHAGENSSNGTCRFLYHDLKLDVSEKGPGEVKPSDRFKMFLANSFVIKKDNPEKGKDPRSAKLFYIRDKEKFMFNYSWKTISTGIKETVGIPEDKKIVKQNAK